MPTSSPRVTILPNGDGAAVGRSSTNGHTDGHTPKGHTNGHAGRITHVPLAPEAEVKDEEQRAAAAVVAAQANEDMGTECPDVEPDKETVALVASFVRHLAAAAPPEVNESATDPHRLARLFADSHYARNGYRTLVYWREEYHRWNGSAYVPVPDTQLRAEVGRCVKREFNRLNDRAIQDWERRRRLDRKGKVEEKPVAIPVSRHLISDVLQALAGEVLLNGSVASPSWLSDPDLVAGGILVCRNGLVNLPSRVYGAEDIYRPTPLFFSANALDYDFDPDPGVPHAWLTFLDQLWEGDEVAIAALQEWFGYCLTPDTSQQKIVMLVGPRRCGKGTVARVLRSTIGEHNTCAPTLASLGTNFGLQPLLGKALAVISDARLSGRTDVAVVTERLLSISGEDAQTIDRKFLPQLTTRLPTRFMVLTNEMPSLDDASGAIAGRMIVLRLLKSWYGKEDTRLTERLLKERPAILGWAIEGYKRLHERGHFIQPVSGHELVRLMEDLCSPIGTWLRECCQQGPDFQALPDALYESWCRWCEREGRDHAGNKQTFAKALHAALPGLHTTSRRIPLCKEKRVRIYCGLKLKGTE